eukprot:Clim_evm28s155 gene=Clim_evmTU28s155
MVKKHLFVDGDDLDDPLREVAASGLQNKQKRRNPDIPIPEDSEDEAPEEVSAKAAKRFVKSKESDQQKAIQAKQKREKRVRRQKQQAALLAKTDKQKKQKIDTEVADNPELTRRGPTALPQHILDAAAESENLATDRSSSIELGRVLERKRSFEEADAIGDDDDDYMDPELVELLKDSAGFPGANGSEAGDDSILGDEVFPEEGNLSDEAFVMGLHDDYEYDEEEMSDQEGANTEFYEDRNGAKASTSNSTTSHAGLAKKNGVVAVPLSAFSARSHITKDHRASALAWRNRRVYQQMGTGGNRGHPASRINAVDDRGRMKSKRHRPGVRFRSNMT